MKQKYIDKNFRQDTLDQIATANAIIEEYARQGFDLTLRQLYYQLAAEHWDDLTDHLDSIA